MGKKVAVFIATGTEEMECVITVDVLRRAGIEVNLVGLKGKEVVKCSRNISIVPDIDFSEAKVEVAYDAIILPGGPGGSKSFCESKELGELLNKQYSEGRIVAAICAAPTALRAHCIAFGKNLTSYPSVESQVMEDSKYTYKTEEVVVDGNLITSRGPGTAFKFSLTLVDVLLGKEKAIEVAKGMLMTY